MSEKVYGQMTGLLKKAYELVDRDWVMKHEEELWKIERKQTFSAYARSARYTYELLKENGFASELLTFPADGKTVYQDKRTPIAWDATVGRLTVLKSPIPFADPVVADFEKEPFSLVKHSVSAPEGGIHTRLVTQSQVFAGEDCTGALVLLEPHTAPRPDIITPILDLGALGFVTEYVVGSLETPDAVQWVTAATEGGNWHVQSEDREFIAYCVSPRIGRQLRQAVLTGGVEVLAESDGRRYEGEVHAVTALLPGKQEREVWVIGHLYEPLSDDNTSGVIGGIAVLKAIRQMIEEGVLAPLNFSVRVVFAMELYGFAAVAEHFGGYLGDKVIGGVNMDGLNVCKLADNHLCVSYGPLSTPFFGNFVMKMALESYNRIWQEDQVRDGRTMPGDDAFLGDPSVGVPIVWPLNQGPHYWHNSTQDMEYLDEEKFARNIAFFAGWTGVVASMNEEVLPEYAEEAVRLAGRLLERAEQEDVYIGSRKGRMDYFYGALYEHLLSFEKVSAVSAVREAAKKLARPDVKEGDCAEENVGTWLSYAENILPERTHVGLPQDLVKIPMKKRKSLPDGMLYGPMTLIMFNMDGKKNLKQLILEAVWEKQVPTDDRKVKSYVDAVLYLAEAGYLKVRNSAVLTKKDIAESLEKIGICKGDVLLVHSSQSGLGQIEGGADTIIDALTEAVGEDGAVLMPSFTRPYLQFEGSLNKGKNYRPKSDGASDIDAIWTGEVPKRMLARDGVVRSAHCSHSWCGLGGKAKECVKHHALLDPPASENSPMAYALKEKGKVLFFGCDIASNTFLHYLEDQADADFLENAVVKIKDSKGRLHTEVVKRHLPGHREFYRTPAIRNGFYTEALKKGLKIRQEKLGNGLLSLMDLEELYRIGMEMFAEDPLATLCKDPDCLYCQSYRKK